MPEIPKIVRDAKLLSPSRLGPITGKVALFLGTSLATVGFIGVAPAKQASITPETIVTISKPSDKAEMAGLVLTPSGGANLIAQHRSHSSHRSHASHYSGASTRQTTTLPSSSPPPAPSSSTSKASTATSGAKQTSTIEKAEAKRASLTITSEPSAADIEINGKYVGSTKSAVKLSEGSHKIKIKKSGYEAWTSTVDPRFQTRQ
jgi:hypothetical protein